MIEFWPEEQTDGRPSAIACCCFCSHEPVGGWRLGLISVTDLIRPHPLPLQYVCVWDVEASPREGERS